MMIAAIVAGLYFVRLNDLGHDLKVGDYDLYKIPFGLFVLAGSSLVLSSVSLIRIGDSRSYDRHLMLACEKRFPDEPELHYLAFPNEHAWGEPFARMVSVVDAGGLAAFLRMISLLLTNAFLLFVSISPLIVGFDFLLFRLSPEASGYRTIQLWTSIFLLVTNTAILFLMMWARLVDRE